MAFSYIMEKYYQEIAQRKKWTPVLTSDEANKN